MHPLWTFFFEPNPLGAEPLSEKHLAETVHHRHVQKRPPTGDIVITSYSIHYTKLYECGFHWYLDYANRGYHALFSELFSNFNGGGAASCKHIQHYDRHRADQLDGDHTLCPCWVSVIERTRLCRSGKGAWSEHFQDYLSSYHAQCHSTRNNFV